MLQAVQLTKRYGEVTALAALELEVAPGEVLCLLGANGAGKSTTVNLMLGFLAPTSGEARVAGRSVQEDPAAARRQLAYVPEQVALYPQLSGVENLEYLLSLGTPRPPARARLCALLEEAGLPREALGRAAATYSKGMRQKVALALAAARGTRALLLDEPASGLDPRSSLELSALLRHLAGQGAAVLVVTHDLRFARETAHRIGVMRQGRLLEQLSPAGLDLQALEARYLALTAHTP